MAAQQFECGFYCEKRILEGAVTAATSVPLLGYVGYLVKTKSRRRGLQLVRLFIAIYLVVRVFAVLVPSNRLFTALFVSPRQVALFLGIYEWHKTVVEVSYRTAKLSKHPPRWIWRYTRAQQAVCLLFFPLTYALGASPTGNPRCSALQAINSSYRWVAGVSIGVALMFCHYVVHKQVASVNARGHSDGGDTERDEIEEKRAARYREALKKIRRINILLIVAILIVSYTFFNSLLQQGEPTVACGSTFAAAFGPISGALGAFLVLWSTSVSAAKDRSTSTSGSSKTTASTKSSTASTTAGGSHRRSKTADSQTKLVNGRPPPAKTGCFRRKGSAPAAAATSAVPYLIVRSASPTVNPSVVRRAASPTISRPTSPAVDAYGFASPAVSRPTSPAVDSYGFASPAVSRPTSPGFVNATPAYPAAPGAVSPVVSSQVSTYPMPRAVRPAVDPEGIVLNGVSAYPVPPAHKS